MLKIIVSMTALLLLSITIHAADEAVQSKALNHCIHVTLNSISHAEKQLPVMQKAAEAAAKSWIASNEIYTAGDPCATDELFYRAGGLIGLKRVGPYNREFNGIQRRWNKVAKKSVIIYSMHRNINPDVLLFENLRDLKARGDVIIFFGSSKWMACRRVVSELSKKKGFFFIDTGIDQHATFKTDKSIKYGDYGGMATTVHAWAFTAELIAACTRLGKTPCIWPSGSIPQYEAWEKKYQTANFHDVINVKPIEPLKMGKEFLEILKQQVQACADASDQLRAGAKLLAKCPADKAVYTMVESHLLANETRFPKQLPNWILAQRYWRWRNVAPTLEDGDSIYWLGNYNWPKHVEDQALKNNHPLVGVSLYGPKQNAKHIAMHTPENESAEGNAFIDLTTQLDPVGSLPNTMTWVRAPWQYPDGVVKIDNYPLPACPTSSIIQGVLLWGMVGEVLALQGY